MVARSNAATIRVLDITQIIHVIISFNQARAYILLLIIRLCLLTSSTLDDMACAVNARQRWTNSVTSY